MDKSANSKILSENPLAMFKQIRHFMFDIDGVLTDGSVFIHADGQLLRTMHIRDGYAIQHAIRKGYSVTIISGAKGEALQKRLTGLGVADIYLGIDDKEQTFHEVINARHYALSEILYMGDDMPDVGVLQQVALPCCPSDACPEVQLVSTYISPFFGGKGCVRDVIEKVMKLNDNWA